MPSLKTFTQGIRRELALYIQGFTKNIADAAFILATETFKKTRFTSHIFFLSRCLRQKIIPTGFKLNFNANTKQKAFRGHLTKCSFNLIRSTLRDHQHTVEKCSTSLPGLVNHLRFICNDYEHFHILRKKIHMLNQSLYEFLKDLKQKKFDTLIREQRPSRTNPQTATPRNIVYTIPDDLPLTNDERSVLNKGLKFIPRKYNLTLMSSKQNTMQKLSFADFV